MSLQLIDHTDSKWLSRFQRINGALTYSQDLVKYQIPKWKEVLGEDCIVSTCPKFNDTSVTGKYKVAIQYLHSYPYQGAISKVNQVLWQRNFKADKLIFITAYKEFERQLKDYGINAVFIPMSIDVHSIQQYQAKEPTQDNKRLIYFGNIIQTKVRWYNKLKQNCQLAGWELDTMSTCKFNRGKVLNKEQIFRKLSEYKYGVGVGRAAQEMHSLGLKVMIGGTDIGGLITNPSEYRRQLNTNMNARIWTFSDDIKTCLENIDKSKVFTTDIKELNHAEIVKNAYNI